MRCRLLTITLADFYVGVVSLTLPAIAVLCPTADDRPAHLEPLDGRVDLRFTDAAGLGQALDGARGLLLWDFFSKAVEDVWDHAGDLEWIHVAAAGVDKLLFDRLRESLSLIHI